MSVRLPVSLALLSVGTACARPSNTVFLPAVPYSVRADTADTKAYEEPSNVAARTLGIPLLSNVTLPAGARELRISNWWSMIFGSPLTVLRLIELPGHPAVGQLIEVWPQLNEWRTTRRPDRCTDWSGGRREC